jgi:hypothetical protein
MRAKHGDPRLMGSRKYGKALEQDIGTSQRPSRKHPERPLQVDGERGLRPGTKSVRTYCWGIFLEDWRPRMVIWRIQMVHRKIWGYLQLDTELFRLRGKRVQWHKYRRWWLCRNLKCGTFCHLHEPLIMIDDCYFNGFMYGELVRWACKLNWLVKINLAWQKQGTLHAATGQYCSNRS